MYRRIAEFLVKRRLALFIASTLFVVLSCLGFSKLKYTADYKVFFSPDDPYLKSFQTLQDTFTKADTVVFVVLPKKGDMFQARALDATLWLTRESWKLPYSIRVDSLSNFQHTEVAGDELKVADLVPATFDGSEAAIREIRERAMNDSMVVKRLLSPSGDMALVVTTLELPEDQQVGLPNLYETSTGVYALVERFSKQYPDMDIHVTGVSMVNYMLGTVASRDIGVLMPILVVVVLVLVGLMTRSVSNTIVTFVVIVFSVAVAMGLVSWFGMTLDNVSAVSPMIILTLAVADSVHLLSYYSTKLREGLDKESAMIAAFEGNLKAVFLTSSTTSIGFLGMNTIDSPPFVKFGYVSAIGITAAYFLSHMMLPQLAIWISRAHKGAPEVHEDKFHSGASEWVIRNPKKVFYTTMGLSLALSSMMVLNDLNDDNIGYFSKHMPVRVATELAQDHGFGLNSIEYTMDAREEYGITDPVFLKKVDAFVEWYRQQPEVVHVASFTETLKRLNQNMNGNDPAAFKLPESRELAAQYLLMYEMSLPQGMDLNNQINTPKSKLRVTASTKMLKAKQNIGLEERAQDWLAKNMPELQVHGAGPTIMFSHIGQTNLMSVAWGTGASLAIICGCMIFGFGSIRLGIMALLPNIFPTAIMLGLWGFFVGEVNMGVAVVFTIADGIIVDDTIHLFTKYSEGLRKGLNVDDAIRYTFEQAGKGVLITTTVLAAGFAMLMFSDFVVNRTLGIMVAGTIAIAVLFDLLFLPSVLKVFPVDTSKFYKKPVEAA